MYYCIFDGLVLGCEWRSKCSILVLGEFVFGFMFGGVEMGVSSFEIILGGLLHFWLHFWWSGDQSAKF